MTTVHFIFHMYKICPYQAAVYTVNVVSTTSEDKNCHTLNIVKILGL